MFDLDVVTLSRLQFALTALHHRGLLGLLVVVLEQVEHAVHDEQGEFLPMVLDGRPVRGREMFGGNVKVTIDVWFRTGRNDVDGPVKLILDSLNDIVWNDDRQITTYTVSKYIAETANNVGCQIHVTEAGA